MQARYDFYYGYLGVENEDHPLRKSFDHLINTTNECIVTIDTFIDTQHTFNELGIDGAKVVNKLPTALSYAPESVRIKFHTLKHTSVKVKEMSIEDVSIHLFCRMKSYSHTSQMKNILIKL